jgi:hypothetical protein
MPSPSATSLSLAVVALMFALAPRAAAQQQSNPSTAASPKLEEAVARGLDYLARQQNPDGSFGAGKNPDGTPGTAAAPPAAGTGLALLAFLAAGDAPELGRHGAAVRGAVDYLVSAVPESGYVGAQPEQKGDGSRMYGQAIVTLALAQAHGLEADRERRLRTRAALTRLAGVIVAAQKVPKSEIHAGGWRHAPDATDSDLSVTSWSALALVACRDVGIDVPADALQRAAQYALKCRNPLDKGFSYQPAAQGQAAMTGSAIVLLNLLGDTGSANVLADASRFLAQSGGQPAARFQYYGAHQVIQAALLAGGATWDALSRPIFTNLVTAQAPDGGWPASPTPEEPGRVYATAMAVLTLAAPNRLLPVYQR